MPEAPRRTRQLNVVGTVALVFALGGSLPLPAHAQAAAAKAGDDVFPLTPLWNVHLGAFPRRGPVYDEGRAFVVLASDPETGSSSARLAAFSLGNGSKQWSRDVGEVDAVAAGDDQVFACGQGALSGFSAADGEPRWQIPLPAPLSAPLHYEAGWLIAVTEASNALAIRASDGVKVWEAHLPSPAIGEPAVAGDGLYLPLTDNRVLRVTIETGEVVWDRKIVSQPVVLLALGDRLFVGTIRWFYALDPKDGKVLWRSQIGARVIGTPSADRDRVYFLALDNLLRALEREGGTLRWRQILVHREEHGPVLLFDLALVSGRSPAVQAYETKRGAAAGSYDAPDDLAAPVHVVRGLVQRDFLLIVLTGEGQFIALRPRSLQPEAFAVSPRTYLITGFPIWRW